MSKLRVHDMAGEFGISADEVIALLRQMDVPVRSHLSLLTDDQVSRIRARWEREKRVRAEKAQPAPAAAPRRRRTGAAAGPDAPAPVVEAEAPAPAVRRRRAAEVDAHAGDVHAGDVPPTEAHAAEPHVEEAHPVEAKVEATHSAAASSADQAPVEPAPEVRADIEHVSVERAAELKAAAANEPVAVRAEAPVVEAPPAPKPKPKPVSFERKDTAPAQRPAMVSAPTPRPAPIVERPAVATPPAASVAPVAASASAATSVASDAPAVPSAPLPADRPRPRPVVPGAPRPGRMGGSPNFGGARPIASAAPGGGLGQGQRRDDRRPGGPQGGQGGAPGGGQGGQPGQGTQGTGMAASAQSQQRRGKKGKRGAVDQEAVSANITKTMTAMRGAGARGRGGRRFGADMRAEMEEQRVAAVEKERKTVRVNEFITVSELAKILGVSATQIVGFAFKTLGLMVTINQRLDFDQIELIAGEFGFQAVKESDYAADLQEEQVIDAPEDLRPRPPVVTIMGHVDHGKTSLLDYIRKANVVAGEAGGITQHIGAYHVEVANKRLITFLDTPGHEAFTAMRARGAQVTDIVVIVIAADDQVMPQTVEAISHAKSAGVPIIIAINKVDLPTAQIAKVKQDLLQHEVVLEEFGGTVLHSEISAKKGTGVDELLDQILLQADILELKANPSRRAVGSVVEAQLDQGKGPVATVLVSNGTLKVGDDYICGIYSGRVRAMLDERGKAVKSAGPAIPVQILGLSGVPMAGDQLLVVEDASEARDIAQRRERLDREAKSRRSTRGLVSLEDFMSQTSAGQKRSLRLVIKADQGGPAEALADALGQLSNPEVQVEILHRGVGAIAETDILLAKASGAIIIGFHVRPDNNARAAAEREGVDIKLYRIIYEAVADVKAALEGMLRPESREVVYGEAEVRETFKVARIGTIAGCIVRSGNMNRKGRMRVIRDGVEIYDGGIASLRRFKDDVNEVKEGYECGIGIENFNDVKIGDVFECYRTEEVARTLDQAAKS
ncbi:translation initiation factor IF-2 [Gemmatimonas sp.]|uniref:translation initiation factor IF-2 n=1 Tax=Gemmatimonas sp. TaxID=1962908 RepID=UPI00286E349B|nr:translation initiation factor IF-2 [Gemmatimonas sp.]